MTRKELIKNLVKYFKIEELVCPHTMKAFGEGSWRFLDKNLLIFLLWFRETIDRPITINNYHIGGSLSQRGNRCILCDLVKSKVLKNRIYLSEHLLGSAFDCNVKGMSSKDVENWLEEHKNELPVPIRLERNTNGWSHIGFRVTDDTVPIEYFNG